MVAGTPAIIDLSEIHRRIYELSYNYLAYEDVLPAEHYGTYLLTMSNKEACFTLMEYILENYRRGYWESEVVRQHLYTVSPFLVKPLENWLPCKIHEVLDEELSPPDHDPILLKEIKGKYMRYLFLPSEYRNETHLARCAADISGNE